MQPEDERAARIRQARQVLAGSDLRPPQDPWAHGDGRLLDPSQIAYLAVLVLLALIALALYLVWGMGVASVALFLLALALLGGWFVF